MKKLFFALFAATVMFSVSSFAQVEEEQTQPEETITALAEALEIEFDQLPETVQTSFEDSDYALWEVVTIKQMVSNEGTTYYKMTVSDGTQEENILYNEEGKEVEE